VQLAVSHGAHVIATVSARNIEFVRSMGAQDVIDHRATRFEDSAKQVDVVLDTVGGETLDRSWGVLAPGGRLVTVAATAEASADPRVKKSFFIVEGNNKQLAGIAALLQEGKLQPFVDAVVPMSRASEAYAGTIERHGRGKIVVAISEDTV
jgi:NADPH:quinone reductase-like Zn-dependent oxidoreductase